MTGDRAKLLVRIINDLIDAKVDYKISNPQHRIREIAANEELEGMLMTLVEDSDA